MCSRFSPRLLDLDVGQAWPQNPKATDYMVSNQSNQSIHSMHLGLFILFSLFASLRLCLISVSLICFLQFCNPLRSAPCPHDISWKNFKMTWILSPPNRNKILGMKMHLHISSHTKGDLHCYADLDCAALNLNLSTSLNQVEAKRHIDLLYKGNQAFLQLLGSRFWETQSPNSTFSRRIVTSWAWRLLETQDESLTLNESRFCALSALKTWLGRPINCLKWWGFLQVRFQTCTVAKWRPAIQQFQSQIARADSLCTFRSMSLRALLRHLHMSHFCVEKPVLSLVIQHSGAPPKGSTESPFSAIPSRINTSFGRTPLSRTNTSPNKKIRRHDACHDWIAYFTYKHCTVHS